MLQSTAAAVVVVATVVTPGFEEPELICEVWSAGSTRVLVTLHVRLVRLVVLLPVALVVLLMLVVLLTVLLMLVVLLVVLLAVPVMLVVLLIVLLVVPLVVLLLLLDDVNVEVLESVDVALEEVVVWLVDRLVVVVRVCVVTVDVVLV